MAHPYLPTADGTESRFDAGAAASTRSSERRRSGRRSTPAAGVLRWAGAVVLALGAVGLQLVEAEGPARSEAGASTASSGAATAMLAGRVDEGVAIGLLQSVRGGR